MPQVDSPHSSLVPSQAVQVMIVDDEWVIAHEIQTCLEQLGYGVVGIVSTGAEAIAQAKTLRPNLILIDVHLEGETSGIEAAEEIWRRLHIPILFSTPFSDRETMERAKLSQPFGYVLKPIEKEELYVAIETALQQFQTTQELRDREQWFATVLRDIGDGVIVVDPQTRIKFMNLIAQVLTGWSQDEAEERPLQDVFQARFRDTQQPAPLTAVEALQSGTIAYLPERVELVAKNGSVTPIADSSTPMRDQDGNLVGAILLFRDITQRRLVEERNEAIHRASQLEIQMEELRRLHQLKDDFLNTVSHELRTPLTSMKMAIHMLEILLGQQGVLSATTSPGDRIDRYFQILRDQCNQEMNLINDLLDLQRLNVETIPLSTSTIVLHEWLPKQVDRFLDQCAYYQQHLTLTINPPLPAIQSDIVSLERVIAELLNNACKYTPSGETITVTAGVAPLRQVIDAPTVEIRITNSGTELTPLELASIFDQFSRIVRVDVRNQGGTGLGLTLVHKLLHRLGGEIRAESGNRYVSFIVKLPFEPPV